MKKLFAVLIVLLIVPASAYAGDSEVPLELWYRAFLSVYAILSFFSVAALVIHEPEKIPTGFVAGCTFFALFAAAMSSGFTPVNPAKVVAGVAIVASTIISFVNDDIEMDSHTKASSWILYGTLMGMAMGLIYYPVLT